MTLEGQGRIDATCSWCDLPATSEVIVEVGHGTDMPRNLPVCDDHAGITERPIVKPARVKRGTDQGTIFDLLPEGPGDALTGG